MRLSIGAGAEVDVLSSQEYFEDQHNLRKILQNRTTKDRALRKTSVASGQWVSDPLILDHGDAPNGALWVPLWITIVGSDDNSTVANARCALYFGGDSGNLSLANLLVAATASNTVPYWQQLGGDHGIYGHSGDHFMTVIHAVGGAIAAGQNFISILRYKEIHPAAVAELNLL